MAKKKPKELPPEKKRAVKAIQSNQVVERITRQAVVRKMIIQGFSSAMIASTVGLSINVVREDVKALYEEFAERAAIDYTRHIAEQLARIELLERETWDAWERSKGRLKKIHKEIEPQEIVVNGVKKTVRKILSSKLIYEQQVGDPAYLNVLIKCIQERSKLLGLEKLQDEQTDYDDVPIVAVVIDSKDQAKKITDAQTFLVANTVEGKVVIKD